MDPLPFVSIVVPAHNEAAYIEATLQHLLALDYPRERFEVVVVENGSTDETLALARAFSSQGVQVLSTVEAGVSRARNAGARSVSASADWILFLDADTFIDPPFLRSLMAYLATPRRQHMVVGSAWLEPYPPTLSMRMIYGCSNVAFMVARAAYGGALLVRRSLFDTLAFDEGLAVGEDADFVRKAKRAGKFFFFRSPYVHTSTRRFAGKGYRKIPIWVGMWLFAILSTSYASHASALQHRFKYKAIR